MTDPPVHERRGGAAGVDHPAEGSDLGRRRRVLVAGRSVEVDLRQIHPEVGAVDGIDQVVGVLVFLAQEREDRLTLVVLSQFAKLLDDLLGVVSLLHLLLGIRLIPGEQMLDRFSLETFIGLPLKSMVACFSVSARRFRNCRKCLEPDRSVHGIVETLRWLSSRKSVRAPSVWRAAVFSLLGEGQSGNQVVEELDEAQVLDRE